MYRISFQRAAPTAHHCETLEQARAVVVATVGEVEVLRGDDNFWLCCRNINDSDSEVVARIYLEPETQERPPAEAGGRSFLALRVPSSEEREHVPESAERSNRASGEVEALSRRTPTGS